MSNFYLYDINAKKYVYFLDSQNRFIPSDNMITKFSFIYDYDSPYKNSYFIKIDSDIIVLYDKNYTLYVSNSPDVSIDFVIIENDDNTVSIYDKEGTYFIRMYTPDPENNPQFKQYILSNTGTPTHFFKKYPNGPDYSPPSPLPKELRYSCSLFGCKKDINGNYTSDECSNNCHSLLYLIVGSLLLIFFLIFVIYLIKRRPKPRRF